jgi:signal transduction histidine kinase
VAEKDLERIFEMFYTTKPRGTGLGLSCARRIAEAHGGRLQAASAAGWTVFTATMPLNLA